MACADAWRESAGDQLARRMQQFGQGRFRSDREPLDGLELPSYRGDIHNEAPYTPGGAIRTEKGCLRGSLTRNCWRLG